MPEKNPYISVVIPCYKTSHFIVALSERLIKTLTTITENFEIIFVDDCSPESDWNEITKAAANDQRIKGIRFSRNYGQHYAITAGLDLAAGEWVVVMDGDLQDLPEEITALYNKTKEGYDIVQAQRVKRNDSFNKRMGSKLFYKLFHYLTEEEYDSTTANFSIARNTVIKAIISHREQNRLYPLMLKMVGFKTTSIAVTHGSRPHGKTAYSYRKLFNLAIDNIITHSNKPLRLSIKLGLFLAGFSILWAIYLIGKYIFLGVPVQGWTSIMVSIYFLGGMLFANLGLLGLYVGKIFNEVKNRPLYTIKETLGTFHNKNKL